MPIRKRAKSIEWYVYDKKGERRKALPHEIPKPLEVGVSIQDGQLVPKDQLKPKKRGGKKNVIKKKREASTLRDNSKTRGS